MRDFRGAMDRYREGLGHRTTVGQVCETWKSGTASDEKISGGERWFQTNRRSSDQTSSRAASSMVVKF